MDTCTCLHTFKTIRSKFGSTWRRLEPENRSVSLPRLYRYSAKIPEVAAAVARERFCQFSAARMAVGFRFLIISQTDLSTKRYEKAASIHVQKRS